MAIKIEIGKGKSLGVVGMYPRLSKEQLEVLSPEMLIYVSTIPVDRIDPKKSILCSETQIDIENPATGKEELLALGHKVTSLLATAGYEVELDEEVRTSLSLFLGIGLS